MIDLLAKIPARWIDALIILLASIAAGAMAFGLITYFNGVDDRREAQREFNASLCTAIPNAAAAGAQALVNVITADSRRRGVPEAQIAQTISLGRVYVAEARRLALADLTECPQR